MPSTAEPGPDLTVVSEAVRKALQRLIARGADDSGVGDTASSRGGVPTGFSKLDALLGGGLWRGHLTVIGGRAGVGTSTFAMDIARSAAVQSGVVTVILCTDVSTDELTLRLLSAEGSVPNSRLRNGTATDDDLERLAKAAPRLHQAPLYLGTPPSLTVQGVEAALQQVSGARPGLLVVDGLQTLLPSRVRETPYYEVSENVHQLKRLARQYDVPVLITSKLNRAPEYRPDRLPQLHDLRNAGDIEDVADEVLLLHRDDLHDSESERSGEADLIVAKNRHGSTRTIVLAFQGHYSRFVDLHDY